MRKITGLERERFKKFRLVFPSQQSIEETKCWSQKELWGLMLKDRQGLVSESAKRGRSKAAKPEMDHIHCD